MKNIWKVDRSNKVQPRYCYLLVSSAFCRFVDLNVHKNSLHNIISNFNNGCFYYILQFCIAEVFNTFAKWHYAEKKITPEKYKELCASFKILIRNRFIFHPHNLHRYHNLNCDKIYKVEHKTPRSKKTQTLYSWYSYSCNGNGMTVNPRQR
jgi:hypothetical protein